MSTCLYSSEVTAVSGGTDTITLIIPGNKASYSHWFAAVEFYSDAAATTVVQPTGGTSTYTVKTTVLPGSFTSISANNNGTPGQIDYATSNEPVDWSAPTIAINVDVDSITGTNVDYMILRVHCSET